MEVTWSGVQVSFSIWQPLFSVAKGGACPGDRCKCLVDAYGVTFPLLPPFPTKRRPCTGIKITRVENRGMD